MMVRRGRERKAVDVTASGAAKPQRRTLCRRVRAVWDADKASRRQDLLNGAARLFATREFGAIGIQDMCREAAVAKGTFYLYFGSKEEIFLAVATDRVRAWATDACGALRALGVKATAAHVATAYSASFAGYYDLLRLLSMLHPILERNVDAEKIVPFKRAMVEIQAEQTPHWRRLYPAWTDEHVAHVMLYVTTAVVGIWPLVSPPDPVREAVAIAGLVLPESSFEKIFADQLTVHITGLAAVAPCFRQD